MLRNAYILLLATRSFIFLIIIYGTKLLIKVGASEGRGSTLDMLLTIK